MNLLLIADDITTIGGAERVVVNLANAFSIMRFDSIYVFGGGGNPQIEILSTKRNRQDIAYPLNPNIRVTYYDFPIHKDDIKAIKGQYKRLYIKSKVLLYKLKFLINLRFIKTAEVLQRKLNIAINKNQYDFVIDNTWANFYPFYKNTNTKYIKILHSSVAFQCIHQPENFFIGLKAFDCLVYPASQIDIWQHYHKNIKVIPNFLPSIPQVSTNHSQKFVLSVGRFSSEKGFLRLLDIWKMVRDRVADSRNGTDLREWQLIIVGDGVLKNEIQSKIRTLNLQDSVILKPFTKDIECEYLGASIYAMASHFEGFGMVLAEASSYALPCIAFDIATGPSDIIEHNKSGFLIADNDLESYADKLIALMSDENLRKRFGAESRKIVSERFSREFVMGKWEEVFKK